MRVPVNDIYVYLYIMLGCAHEQSIWPAVGTVDRRG